MHDTKLCMSFDQGCSDNAMALSYDLSPTGTIISPGKFQGEPRWAPMFYQQMCEGAGDPDDGWYDGAVIFHVDVEDIASYPELEGIANVGLWEDCQGFVHTWQSRSPVSSGTELPQRMG